MAESILDKLFPPAPAYEKRARIKDTGRTDFADVVGSARVMREDIPTRWASVYTLELRGLTRNQIAEALGMSVGTVSRITLDPRYIEYREKHLSSLDQEFVAMKPLAFQALRGGLRSTDENTALRASEQWFKAANYGGFSKHERPAVSTSAEDIAKQLLQINVQVNVNPGEPQE